jgi:tetratricopeptide (TPR) repeat protein
MSIEEGKTMQRSRGILLVPVILLFLGVIALAAEILTNDTIVTMVKAGLGQDLILSRIRTSPGQFDLSTSAILKLKSEGVSEKIIQAMIESSAKPGTAEPKVAPGVGAPPALSVGEGEAIALYRQGKGAEAVAAFDKLLLERPNDEGLKIWKSLALLEQARAMRETQHPGYKPLVVNAYTILRPLGKSQEENPDWLFAMAKAFWLNERPDRASRVANRVLSARPKYAEAFLLLGDLAYDEAVEPRATAAPGGPRDNVFKQRGLAARKQYEAALALPDLTSALRAEAFYKLGVVSAELEKKSADARDYWEKAVATEPTSRYAGMAQRKLTEVPSR